MPASRDRITGIGLALFPKLFRAPVWNKRHGWAVIASGPAFQEPALRTDDQRRRFELLALPHLDAAYNFARWLTGSPTDAEDVVQEAYLRAYRFFDTFRGGNIRVWLLTIVRNAFHTWAAENRSSRLRFGGDMQEAETVEEERVLWGAPQDDPETLLLREIDHDTVARLVRLLPPVYREALLLREVEELSYRDIAVVTGVPVGTVMSRLARARVVLRRMWHGGAREPANGA
jgi:RNA polymerase sigma factor (sigma-70 family)